MHAEGDHQIVNMSRKKMVLLDNATGNVVVSAIRSAPGGDWTVSARGIADITVPPDTQPSTTYRQGVIQAMVDHALASQPGTGYSCVVPHGLETMP
jgi:hypothetical protein